MSDSASSWIADIPESEFEKQVIEKSKEVPVVVDFWAPWCGPCRMLGPVLEKLVEERKGEVFLAKVNIDENQNIAMTFQVSSIPMVIAFRDGQAVDQFMGVMPEGQLRSFLDQLQPSKAEQLAKEAQELEESDPVGAEELYRQALAEDVHLELAHVGLARVLAAQGKEEEAQQQLNEVAAVGEMGAEVEQMSAMLELKSLTETMPDEAQIREQLSASPKNAELLYQLGCQLAVQKKYTEALDTLLSAGEVNPDLARTKIREAMVKIFHLIGDQSQQANEYRNRLAMLLF